jgi:tetratricopeptide (TPR) repeat protein
MLRTGSENAKAAELMEQARTLYAACDSPIAAEAEEHLVRWAGDTRKLADSYERRLAVARRSGDRDRECNLLIDLGDSYQKLGDLPRSLEYTENAIAIAREARNRESEGICLHNEGEFRFALGELQASRDYYAKALTIASEIGFQLLEANARWGLAQIENGGGNGSDAIALAESALAIYESIEAKVEAEKARTALAQWRA